MNFIEKYIDFKEKLTTTATYETYVDTKAFAKRHKFLFPILLVINFLIILALVPVFHNIIHKPQNTEQIHVNSPDAEFEQKIYVTVTGEVNKPGMYEMTTENRVADAIDKAGGITDKAYTNDINLAQKLADEQYINVPCYEETITSHSTGFTGIVNINTASADELCKLPGIGEYTANNIIEYRENAGNFERIEDIQNVIGIGSETFSKIKNNITI